MLLDLIALIKFGSSTNHKPSHYTIFLLYSPQHPVLRHAVFVPHWEAEDFTSIHNSKQNVIIHSGIRKFQEFGPGISVGCDMVAVLYGVLPVAFMCMDGKWLHIGTCQLCARAA